MQLSNLFIAHEREPFDFVYHLGAEFGRWNGEDHYDLVWQSNAMGTKNIIRMQERYKFKLIFFSSSEVYGDYDGIMSEDVMEKYAIRQMNDYAISKWVSEMQIMNSADMFGTESVRVRLFNTYGPGEYYSPYRSVICMFTYRALHNMPYTVYQGHTRTSTYITDMVETLSNISDNFIAGEVYNIGGLDYHDIETASNLILKYAQNLNDTTQVDDALVTYKEAEPFTTKHKKVDCSKAIRDLRHDPKVNLETGIKNTVAWMREVYSQGCDTILDGALQRNL
jgi:dTDP-glucose 4,6-dehydratase